MGTLVKILPILIAVFNRSKVLFTAHKSSTTKKQYSAAGLLCMAIAGVGYYFPALQDDAIAGAVITLLLPLVARFALYKEKVLDDAELGMHLIKVNTKVEGDSSWQEFNDSFDAAKKAGYLLGVDDVGGIWDLQTGEALGNIRVKPVTTDEQREQNLRVFRKVRDTLKEIQKETPKDSNDS